MADFSAFLASNAVPDEKVFYPASKRFIDKDGEPIMWEIRSISSEEDERIRKANTKRSKLKNGQTVTETDMDSYLGELAVACTVSPDLNDSGIQDSYHAMGGAQLLKAMLKPGEYQEYMKQVMQVNGFDINIDDLVDEAKN